MMQRTISFKRKAWFEEVKDPQVNNKKWLCKIDCVEPAAPTNVAFPDGQREQLKDGYASIPLYITYALVGVSLITVWK